MKIAALAFLILAVAGAAAEPKAEPKPMPTGEKKSAKQLEQEKANRETLLQKLDAENKGLFDDPKKKSWEQIDAMSKRHIDYVKLASTKEDGAMIKLSLERNIERIRTIKQNPKP